MNKILIAELFQSLQNQTLSQLSTNREFITHPGSKGDALENTWIGWPEEVNKIRAPAEYWICDGIDELMAIEWLKQVRKELKFITWGTYNPV